MQPNTQNKRNQLSQRLTQNLLVMRGVMDRINVETNPDTGECMDKNRFREVVNESIKDTADFLGIGTSTVESKLVREIGISRKEDYVNNLWDFFLSRNRIGATILAEKIVENKTSKDKLENIYAALSSF